MNRVTSDTPMNQASSRSHSIFSVMIEARPVDSEVIVTSKLHLVDLAGSERVYKREGTQRMRTEGKHINLSLHHLEQVILSLRTAKRNPAVSKTYHVPYRNSMLTSVLRGSLGGNCKSVFIATLNPEVEFLDESISTCRFMQRCSEVSVEVAVNSEVDAEKRLQSLERANATLESANFELQARVVQLEGDLKTAHTQLAKHQKEQLAWQQQQTQLQAQVAHLEQQLAQHVQRQRQQQRQERRALRAEDWERCEELVERWLLAGDVERERAQRLLRTIARVSAGEEQENEELEVKSVDDGEGDDEDDEDRERDRLFTDVAKEIRAMGVDSALACLSVMRESTVFASNTAVELQEMMEKQRETVELLEKRLQDQRADADKLKTQIQQLMESHNNNNNSSSSGHTLKGRTRGNGGSAEDSDSDSELDSEAPDSHQYPPHPATASGTIRRAPTSSAVASSTTMSLVFNASGGSNSNSHSNGVTAGVPVAPLPSRQSNEDADEKTGKLGSPAPSTAAPKTGSDLIRRRMELLKNGSLFVKYGRFGKPHVRFVWCSADLEYLHYRKASAQLAKASIPTRGIVRILLGQSTRVFERAKQENREPFCFSIEYEEGRTLDLEVRDGSMYVWGCRESAELVNDVDRRWRKRRAKETEACGVGGRAAVPCQAQDVVDGAEETDRSRSIVT
ncbi:hypothetical protein PINS_up007859 [Pythium insidiosum]|nr:hypothetical protein PINS_up007859 [Pythium insidiosum]